MASPDEPRLQRIEAALDRIEYSIVGNGEPGLNERMRAVERWISAVEQTTELVKKASIGVLIVSLASAAVFIIRHMAT